jgi:hypothetical protein
MSIKKSTVELSHVRDYDLCFSESVVHSGQLKPQREPRSDFNRLVPAQLLRFPAKR